MNRNTPARPRPRQSRPSLARLLATTLGAVLSLVAATAPAQEDQAIDSIVAVVESDVILRSELDQSLEGIVERIRAQGGQLPPQEVMEKQVLERLIMRKLQVQRALQTGIRVSDSDIDQAMVRIAEQNGITLPQMRQVIEQDGEDFGEFRLNIGEELLADRLQQRVVQSMNPVTDTEIEILLASDNFAGDEYNISHIMIALPDGSTPDEVEAAVAKANDVYQRLQDGLDFASAAISYSQSQEALEGGEVGWRDLNQIPAGFADAVKELQPGQITRPIRSPAGLHILKVNDRRDRSRVLVDETHARHIMIEVNELVTAREAMEQIRKLRQRILDGEDFGELAVDYSDDENSANIGGDLGWFPEGAYGPRITQTLDGLEIGEISEPFQTEGGWHIIEKLGERETDFTEEAIRNQARETIRQRKAEEEIDSFMRQMRAESYVDIRIPT